MVKPAVILTQRDLRHRSFRGQRLVGADFSGSDIRGCDFSYAQLRGANFSGVKAGRLPTWNSWQSPRSLIPLVLLIGMVSLITGHAVSHMTFGAVGQTLEGEAWFYVTLLLLVLASAGATSAFRAMTSRIMAGILSALCSGALIGFFYAGVATQNNPQVAMGGAIAGAFVAGGLAWRWTHRLIETATAMAGVVTSYGFAVLMAVLGSGALSVQQWSLGGIFVLLACLYTWFALESLVFILKEIQSVSTTCFRGANLTDATLPEALIQEAEFAEAIGWRGHQEQR